MRIPYYTWICILSFLMAACSSGGDDYPGGEPEPGPTPSENPIKQTLCTPAPSAEAVKVYDYLRENWGQNILSATMANVNWNINEAEWVKQHTGKYPAMVCFDYVHLFVSPANWIDYSKTAIVEEWWKSNGLVAAGWHWNVPKDENSSDYGFNTSGLGLEAETTFDITKALEEGTYENRIIKNDLEKIANYLLLLKNKNIPVIWRPLHEASGRWFWWGAKGAESYESLWKLMFESFQTKGLNNLIWVWTSEGNDNDWYPGDEYVDIIGRDIYNKTSTAEIFTEYQKLTQAYPEKLIALSECGNVANVENQWRTGAQWTWFMPWYDYERTNDLLSGAFKEATHQYADKNWWVNAFKQSNVITRDKLPSMK